MENNRGEICGICGDKQKKGIYLYTLFICNECEQAIIHTNPEDKEYQYYLHKLKNINQSTLYS